MSGRREGESGRGTDWEEREASRQAGGQAGREAGRLKQQKHPSRPVDTTQAAVILP